MFRPSWRRSRSGRATRRPRQPRVKGSSPASRSIQCGGADCRCTDALVIQGGTHSANNPSSPEPSVLRSGNGRIGATVRAQARHAKWLNSAEADLPAFIPERRGSTLSGHCPMLAPTSVSDFAFDPTNLLYRNHPFGQRDHARIKRYRSDADQLFLAPEDLRELRTRCGEGRGSARGRR